jgi:hypothetical protein
MGRGFDYYYQMVRKVDWSIEPGSIDLIEVIGWLAVSDGQTQTTGHATSAHTQQHTLLFLLCR